MINWPYIVVALVVAERTVELLWSRHNTQRLRQRGAIEAGARSFRLMVAVHAAWLIAVLAALPAYPKVDWAWIGALAALQVPRLWAIVTLGPYWTTRILTLAGVPPVRSGPYRFLRHPAYLVAAAEIAVLPLAFAEPWVAVGFSALNALVMIPRIRMEDAALAGKRDGYATDDLAVSGPRE